MSDTTNLENNERHKLSTHQRLVVLYCWAHWCADCHIVSSLIDQLAEEYKGRIKVIKLNVDEKPKTASKFGILGVNSIPITFIFKGGKPVEKIAGPAPYESFRSAISKYLLDEIH
jgi:thioredoxin 1